MGKKLTYKKVFDYIDSQGFKLLDETYLNDHTKLNLECPKGHKFLIIFNSFKNGRRCSVCKGINCTIRQRKPYEEIVQLINSGSLKLLTTKEQYENNYTIENKFFLVKCICSKEFRTTLDRIKKKSLCRSCGNKKRFSKTKKVYKYLNYLIENYLEIDFVNEMSQNINKTIEQLQICCFYYCYYY